MEMTDTKIAIAALVLIVVLVSAIGFMSGNNVDQGTIGMVVTAIAGLAGFDMRNKPE